MELSKGNTYFEGYNLDNYFWANTEDPLVTFYDYSINSNLANSNCKISHPYLSVETIDILKANKTIIDSILVEDKYYININEDSLHIYPIAFKLSEPYFKTTDKISFPGLSSLKIHSIFGMLGQEKGKLVLISIDNFNEINCAVVQDDKTVSNIANLMNITEENLKNQTQISNIANFVFIPNGSKGFASFKFDEDLDTFEEIEITEGIRFQIFGENTINITKIVTISPPKILEVPTRRALISPPSYEIWFYDPNTDSLYYNNISISGNSFLITPLNKIKFKKEMNFIFISPQSLYAERNLIGLELEKKNKYFINSELYIQKEDLTWDKQQDIEVSEERHLVSFGQKYVVNVGNDYYILYPQALQYDVGIKLSIVEEGVERIDWLTTSYSENQYFIEQNTEEIRIKEVYEESTYLDCHSTSSVNLDFTFTITALSPQCQKKMEAADKNSTKGCYMKRLFKLKIDDSTREDDISSDENDGGSGKKNKKYLWVIIFLIAVVLILFVVVIFLWCRYSRALKRITRMGNYQGNATPGSRISIGGQGITNLDVSLPIENEPSNPSLEAPDNQQ